MLRSVLGILEFMVNFRTWKSGWISLQLLAIFYAVSILSPVSIHTFTSTYHNNYWLGANLLWFREHRPAICQVPLLHQEDKYLVKVGQSDRQIVFSVLPEGYFSICFGIRNIIVLR